MIYLRFLNICRERYLNSIKYGNIGLKEHYKKQFLAEIKYLKKTFKK